MGDGYFVVWQQRPFICLHAEIKHAWVALHLGVCGSFKYDLPSLSRVCRGIWYVLLAAARGAQRDSRARVLLRCLMLVLRSFLKARASPLCWEHRCGSACKDFGLREEYGHLSAKGNAAAGSGSSGPQ